jgi:hypothetical protein
MSTPSGDKELDLVAQAIREVDPDGARTAQVLRDTLDQLYDGQRTGRYRWDQLFKTEKTHCGTLVEINLQREFRPAFGDGLKLDYKIAGIEVDCKYSQKLNGWMIPPEAHGHLCLVVWAEDKSSKWCMGLVRIAPDRLNLGSNRDAKATLNQEGRDAIVWLFRNAELPPNVLLQLDPSEVDGIMALKHGTKRINALFEKTLGHLVGRAAVATVGQQKDFMKRVRANGGARTALKGKGIVILGPYGSHLEIARKLGLPLPKSGESIAVKLVPVAAPGGGVVCIEDCFWRVAKDVDPIVTAPELPSVSEPDTLG